MYWPSEAAKKRHATFHRNEQNQPTYTREEISDEFCQIQNENKNDSGLNEIPIIEDLQEFLRCPFRWPDDKGLDVEFDEILM